MAYTRKQAEIEMHRLCLMETEEHKQNYGLRFANTKATKTRFISEGLLSPIRCRVSNPYSSIPPMTPPEAPLPPYPPDFPKFDGTGVREWINRCEQFIYRHNIPPEQKSRLASLNTEGKALQWNCEFIHNHYGLFPSWPEYFIAVSARFCEPSDGIYLGKFECTDDSCLKKNTTPWAETNATPQTVVIHEVKSVTGVDSTETHKTYGITDLDVDDDCVSTEPIIEPKAEEPYLSTQEIESNGATYKMVIDLVQDEESSLAKDSRPEEMHVIETFPCPQVLISDLEQIWNNGLQSHSGVVLDELRISSGVDAFLVPKFFVRVKEMAVMSQTSTRVMRVFEKNKVISWFGQANHVWKPGGLQAQRDWLQHQRNKEDGIHKAALGYQYHYAPQIYEIDSSEAHVSIGFTNSVLAASDCVYIQEMVLQFPLAKTWRFKFKGKSESLLSYDGEEKVTDKIFGRPMVHQNQKMRRFFTSSLTCNLEKKKLKGICVDNKKKKNCYLRVVELTWVLDSEKLHMLQIEVMKESHTHVLLKGSAQLVLMLSWMVCSGLFFISYTMFRSSSVIQKKNQAEGYISWTRSSIYRFLLICLYDSTLQILGSFIHILLRCKAVTNILKKETNNFLGDDTVILAFTKETRVAREFFLFNSGILKKPRLLYEKENSLLVGFKVARELLVVYKQANMQPYMKHRWKSKYLQIVLDFTTTLPSSFAYWVLGTALTGNTKTDPIHATTDYVWKLLNCLGVHNKKFVADSEIYFGDKKKQLLLLVYHALKEQRMSLLRVSGYLNEFKDWWSGTTSAFTFIDARFDKLGIIGFLNISPTVPSLMRFNENQIGTALHTDVVCQTTLYTACHFVAHERSAYDNEFGSRLMKLKKIRSNADNRLNAAGDQPHGVMIPDQNKLLSDIVDEVFLVPSHQGTRFPYFADSEMAGSAVMTSYKMLVSDLNMVKDYMDVLRESMFLHVLLQSHNKDNWFQISTWFDSSFDAFNACLVFHLQRPPELYRANGVFSLSSLRTRMFSTREYCGRNPYSNPVQSTLVQWPGLTISFGLIIFAITLYVRPLAIWES